MSRQKPKSKYNIDIKSAEDYKKLYEKEQNYFKETVDDVKKSVTNFVICQWGFDDEANHLLMHNILPSVRWVDGAETQQTALASGGRLINNFKDIAVEKFGKAYEIKGNFTKSGPYGPMPMGGPWATSLYFL